MSYTAHCRVILIESLFSPYERVFPVRHLHSHNPVALYFTVTTYCLIGKFTVIKNNVCFNIQVGYIVISVKTNRCVCLYFELHYRYFRSNRVNTVKVLAPNEPK